MAEIITTKKEGITYLSSSGGRYVKTKIDAPLLRKYEKNPYGSKIATTHGNLIFNEKYSVEVKDEDGNPDEELARTIQKMCDRRNVRLWPKMKLAWNQVFWYGMAFFNPVWQYSGNVYSLAELNPLPAHSFATAPYGRASIYSDILQGVTINPTTGRPEYYQTLETLTDNYPVTQSFSGKMLQTKLEYVFTVSDPAIGELAGRPIVQPVAPIFGMLDFSWQAQMQKVNRIGAPLMFLEVTEGSEKDNQYAQQFLANWGKNTGHQLKPNMRLIIPDLKDNMTALDTINALAKLIVDYFTPASLIAKDGTLIGGSSNAEQELLLSYIRATHSWIQESFEQLLNTYLEVNDYVGYEATIYIPSPSIDKSETWIKQALALGSLTRAGLTVASENEFRDLLEMKTLDPEEVQMRITEREKYREQTSSIPTDLAGLMKANLAMEIEKEDMDPRSILSRRQYAKTIQTALNLEPVEA